MNTENPHHRKFYFTLYEYLSDINQIPDDIIDILKTNFYIERVDFQNTSTLFVYYLDEIILAQYKEALEFIAMLLGCKNLINIDMNNPHIIENIQTMKYNVYLEMLYLKS